MRAFEVIVSPENLEAGLAEWRRRSTSGNWARDLHAGLYRRQSTLRANGLDDEWWVATVDELSRWRAIRPLSKSTVLEKGRGAMPRLNKAYGDLLCRGLSFESATWSDIEPLFDVAISLKPTKSASPVFASKLCHFMAPDLYVVIDRAAVGLDCRYPEYWKACETGWRTAKGKPVLQTQLLDWLDQQDASGLPLSTKITELSVIGAKTRA